MKNIILIISISLFGFPLFGQIALSGKWSIGSKNTVVEIEKNNDDFIGKIKSSDNPKAKIGTLIMKDVKLKNGKWKGVLYVPKKKEWCEAEFVPNQSMMVVRVSVGFFRKTVKWTKVE